MASSFSDVSGCGGEGQNFKPRLNNCFSGGVNWILARLKMFGYLGSMMSVSS